MSKRIRRAEESGRKFPKLKYIHMGGKREGGGFEDDTEPHGDMMVFEGPPEPQVTAAAAAELAVAEGRRVLASQGMFGEGNEKGGGWSSLQSGVR